MNPLVDWDIARLGLGWVFFIKISWKSLGLSCSRLRFGFEPLFIIYRVRDLQHHPSLVEIWVPITGRGRISSFTKMLSSPHQSKGNWVKMVQVSWAQTQCVVTLYCLIFNNCLRHKAKWTLKEEGTKIGLFHVPRSTVTKAKPSKSQLQSTHLPLKKERLGHLVLYKTKHWMSRHDSGPITKEPRANFHHSDLAPSDFTVW